MVAKLTADLDELFDALNTVKSKLEQLIATEPQIVTLLGNVTADILPEAPAKAEVV